MADHIKNTVGKSFEAGINLSFDYYIKSFFTEDGIPKYYNNEIFTMDIHCPAQLVVSVERLGRMKERLGLVEKVVNWTIDNMQDPRGFFYCQKKKYWTTKILYVRWSQVWLDYSLMVYKILVDE